MTTLLLVRHGESEWNYSRRLQGQANAPLTVRGREQVRVLRETVRSCAPDRIVSSDLGRARESAEILGLGEPELDPRWREADLGEWTGQDSRELATKDHRYQQWRDGLFTPPGGESFTNLRDRIGGAVRALPDRQTSLVVTHGGVIRVVLDQFIGLPPGHIIPVSPGSLTVIQFHDVARLQCYNVTGSMAGTDDPPD